MSPLSQVAREMEMDHACSGQELLPLVYDELRYLAAAKMAQQPPGHTLQATALVHEAWLKLASGKCASWCDRKHFFRAAAEAMRQILIDRARRRLRVRHGRGAEHAELAEFEIAAPAKEEVLLELNDALVELEAIAPDRAQIVNMRFFAGLSEAEVADILGISERSVQRQWSYARAWLFARMQTQN